MDWTKYSVNELLTLRLEISKEIENRYEQDRKKAWNKVIEAIRNYSMGYERIGILGKEGFVGSVDTEEIKNDSNIGIIKIY